MTSLVPPCDVIGPIDPPTSGIHFSRKMPTAERPDFEITDWFPVISGEEIRCGWLSSCHRDEFYCNPLAPLKNELMNVSNQETCSWKFLISQHVHRVLLSRRLPSNVHQTLSCRLAPIKQVHLSSPLSAIYHRLRSVPTPRRIIFTH